MARLVLLSNPSELSPVPMPVEVSRSKKRGQDAKSQEVSV